MLVTGAALMFALVGVFVKLAAADLPNTVVVFFRNSFGLLALLPWMCRGGREALRTRHPGLHLLRMVLGLSAMYCYFFALSCLPLAEALLLNFTAPLFIPFVAYLWLRERVSPRLRTALAIGFAGVVLVLRPGLTVFGAGLWVGLLSGMLAAGALVAVRRLSLTEPTTRVVFYFSAAATLVSAVPLAVSWVAPQGVQWVWLAGAGLCATLGQLSLTRGYAHAPAAQVGPFHYTAVLFAVAFGWVLWRESIDGWVLAGALLIIIAGVLAARRAGLPAAPLFSGTGKGDPAV
jgi:drug/metabolite transporter (DMT)-like permease